MKKKLFIVILIVSPSLTHAEEQIKKLIGFQNIPWYSTIESVAKKISGGKIQDSCLSDDKSYEKELRESARKDNESCRYLLVSPFMIADHKFLLRANFNSKNRLSNIGICYSPLPSLSHEESLKECGDAYDKVHSLLEIKYGDSLGVKNGTPAMRYENFEMRAWVLSPTEIWIRKSIGRKYDWQAQCVVEINYGPRISESIDKL